jgi:hypothetical protein
LVKVVFALQRLTVLVIRTAIRVSVIKSRASVVHEKNSLELCKCMPICFKEISTVISKSNDLAAQNKLIFI